MPFITVSMYAGRTKAQKTELAKQLTHTFVTVAGTPKDHVWIVFQDVPKSEWAMGGQLQG